MKMTKKQIDMILMALQDYSSEQLESDIWSSEDERVHQQIRSKLLKHYHKNLEGLVK